MLIKDEHTLETSRFSSIIIQISEKSGKSRCRCHTCSSLEAHNFLERKPLYGGKKRIEDRQEIAFGELRNIETIADLDIFVGGKADRCLLVLHDAKEPFAARVEALERLGDPHERQPENRLGARIGIKRVPTKVVAAFVARFLQHLRAGRVPFAFSLADQCLDEEKEIMEQTAVELRGRKKIVKRMHDQTAERIDATMLVLRLGNCRNDLDEDGAVEIFDLAGVFHRIADTRELVVADSTAVFCGGFLGGLHECVEHRGCRMSDQLGAF